MRRSPFVAYPSSFYHDFYPPAPRYASPSVVEDESYHPRLHFPQPPTAAKPAPHPVITIPVHDSSSSPPRQQLSPAVAVHPASNLDRASAATRIQSCFRGFAVRRCKPLLQLRSIAAVRRQLGELQSEFESPGFASRVRASDKDRLRFTESVMALLLRLDAVEGGIPEVRSQRKEATRRAVKLQDAVDALVQGKGRDCDVDTDDSEAMREEDIHTPDIDDAFRVPETIREEDIHTPDIDDASPTMDISTAAPTPEESAASSSVAVNAEAMCALVQKSDAMAADAIVDNSLEQHGDNLQKECFDMEPLRECSDKTAKAEDDGTTMVAGGDDSVMAAECSEIGEHFNVPSGRATESPSRYSSCMSQQQEGGPECIAGIDLPDSLEKREALDSKRRKVCEGGVDATMPPSTDVEMDGGSAMGTFSALTMADEQEAVPSSDKVLLQQLSDDCKQLKSLLGKLLIQNTVQGKVISALGYRLERLEQQQSSKEKKQTRKKSLTRKEKRKGRRRILKCEED